MNGIPITTSQQFFEVVHNFKCLCLNARNQPFEALQFYNSYEILRKVLYGDEVKLNNVKLSIPPEDLAWIFHTLYMNDLTRIPMMLLEFNSNLIEYLRTLHNTPASASFYVTIYFAKNNMSSNKKSFAERLASSIWNQELLAEIIQQIETASGANKRNLLQKHITDSLIAQRNSLEKLDRQPRIVPFLFSSESEAIREYKFMEEAERSDNAPGDSEYTVAVNTLSSMLSDRRDWTEEFKTALFQLIGAINNEDVLYDVLRLQIARRFTLQDDEAKMNAQFTIAVICARLQIQENNVELKEQERNSWVPLQLSGLNDHAFGLFRYSLGIFSPDKINTPNIQEQSQAHRVPGRKMY